MKSTRKTIPSFPYPEILKIAPNDSAFLPLVGGIQFPLNNPMQLGFNIYTDPQHPNLTQEEQIELQNAPWPLSQHLFSS